MRLPSPGCDRYPTMRFDSWSDAFDYCREVCRIFPSGRSDYSHHEPAPLG